MRRTVLALFLVAACGSSTTPIDDVAEFLTRARQADCEASVRCGLFQDVDQCLAFHAQDHFNLTPLWSAAFQQRRVEATARGALIYDPDEAGHCIDDLADRTCDSHPRSHQLVPE